MALSWDMAHLHSEHVDMALLFSSNCEGQLFNAIWKEVTMSRDDAGLAFACNLHRHSYHRVKYIYHGHQPLGT